MPNEAGLRVLVVDDEPDLVDLACVWLGSGGHRTTPTSVPGDALELLASDTFDVLMTDVVMPGGVDGIELASRAIECQPGIRVLLCSGYSQKLLSREAPIAWPLLQKPYRKAELLSAISAVAGAGPSSK
jgi:CheY-like chemotaxis protein